MPSLYAHAFTFAFSRARAYTHTRVQYTHIPTPMPRAGRNVIGLPPDLLCKFAHARSYPSTVHTFPLRLWRSLFLRRILRDFSLSHSLSPPFSLSLFLRSTTETNTNCRAARTSHSEVYLPLRKISAVCSYSVRRFHADSIPAIFGARTTNGNSSASQYLPEISNGSFVIETNSL